MFVPRTHRNKPWTVTCPKKRNLKPYTAYRASHTSDLRSQKIALGNCTHYWEGVGCPAGCKTITQLILHWVDLSVFGLSLQPYMYLSFFQQTSPASSGDVLVQQDLDSEDVALSETIRKTTSAAEASGSDKEAIHSELDDAFASFRRLRNNFLVNFRNFEDLFHDRQRELAKLASKSSKDESEVILRNLDKQELACSNIVKKMKQNLDKLGEISHEKSKVHGLEKQVNGEEIL